MAILCPDAAEKLINSDNRFEVAGTAIVNSNIIVTKNTTVLKKIGVSQNRKEEENIAKDIYGQHCEIVPLIYSSLPYAMENGIVDGMVIDITKGLMIKGNKLNVVTNKDYVSYVLVVRKNFKQDKRYKKFINIYNDSIKDLNKKEIFLDEVSKYKKINIPREVEKWNQWKIKFVPITLQ